jgi:hypothetical protein
MNDRTQNLASNIAGAYVTNQSNYIGRFDLPYVECFSKDLPDYLCLYSERRNYAKTAKTAVCFYEEDPTFDSFDGIFNAIVFKRKELIERYKDRFRGVRFFIAPDYSVSGDMPKYQQIFNAARARLVSIWLSLELGAVTIPNITFAGRDSFDWSFEGIGTGSVVSISLKGMVSRKENRELLEDAIASLTDRIRPSAIIAYTDCSKDLTDSILRYPLGKGIKVVVPDNLLKQRNDFLRGSEYGKRH